MALLATLSVACTSSEEALQAWATDVMEWRQAMVTEARDDLVVEGVDAEEFCARALDRLDEGASRLVSDAPSSESAAAFRAYLDAQRDGLSSCEEAPSQRPAWDSFVLDMAELGVVLPEVEPVPLTPVQESQATKRVQSLQDWVTERFDVYADERDRFWEEVPSDRLYPEMCAAWGTYLDEAESWLLPSGSSKIDGLVARHLEEERLAILACDTGFIDGFIDHYKASNDAMIELFDLLSGY